MIKNGIRWMISFYTELLYSNKIKVAGSAHNRLRELQLKYIDEKKSKN
tara:strand:+ start:14902 stop:15045 length:144 start_codon:yes stop_codon:yes gene_type:complete